MITKDTKSMLHQLANFTLNAKIDRLKRAINEVQSASNNDTKSSAGDKYETGRAMAQLEKDKLQTQLAEVQKLKRVIHQINPKVKSTAGGLGSLVRTDKGSYFISVGIGEIQIDGQRFFAISPVSPIGRLFSKKKVSEQVSFNHRTYSILEIA